MTVRRAPKPNQFDEILRVLTIFDLLSDGLKERDPYPAQHILGEQAQVELLKVAQSIAARTEAAP